MLTKSIFVPKRQTEGRTVVRSFFCLNVVDIRKNDPVFERSHALYGYSELIRMVDNGVSVGKTIEDAAKEAIQYCLNNGLLVELLKIHAREVIEMLETEYD